MKKGNPDYNDIMELVTMMKKQQELVVKIVEILSEHEEKIKKMEELIGLQKQLNCGIIESLSKIGGKKI